jgi:hypothetical protein
VFSHQKTAISDKLKINRIILKMIEEMLPKEYEIKIWLVSTLKHSFHVEYFLEKLGLGREDPERPHDLIGLGNKFEWDVVKGFALQYRNPKPDFKTYILPALEIHRAQYHHQKWNDPDSADITKPTPEASAGDMLVGAVDAVCSLLENRAYQGGAHDYSSVIEVTKKNPPHKIPWMLQVIPHMQELPQPDLTQIASLIDFPNIGVKSEIYRAAVKRVQDTLLLLRTEHDYTFTNI